MNFKLWRTVEVIKDVRRGSALLVVLGMLSFMLFSGLAFSVYMRQSRLPTSFLRRTVATRQLAKAALAEAIEEIDTAIGNDPHPGVRGNRTYNDQIPDNFWMHRVFIGEGGDLDNLEPNTYIEISGKRYYPALVDPDETVPTLTLEGLAYLPPNLINEARFYSQRTPTAKWKSFWFDSGRYAYTAIDVSDYFDVNRVYANKPRSSDASRRITFAHVFEESVEELHDRAGSHAGDWDSFVNQYREINDVTGEITFKKCPFVSVADFNIAFGEERCGIKNPFYNFINGGSPYEGAGDSADDPTAEKYRCMTFVTDGWDGWHPKEKTERRKTPEGIEIIDLAKDDNQPFPSLTPTDDTQQNDSFVMSETVDYLQSRLCTLSQIALLDYLDANNVPLSLALPTVERTPMICGIRPMVDKSDIIFKRKDVEEEVSRDEKSIKKKLTTTVSINLNALNGNITANVSLLYPFLDRGFTAKDFKLDGRISLFFVDEKDGDAFTLRIGAVNGLYFADKREAEARESGYDGSVIRVAYPESEQIVGSDDFEKDSQVTDANNNKVPVLNFPLLKGKSVTQLNDDYVIATIVNEWEVPLDEDGNEMPGYQSPPDDGSKITSVTLPQDKNKQFKRLSAGNLQGSADVAFLQKNESRKINAYVSVVARVANNGGKTVDLVPACKDDDLKLNEIRNEEGRLNEQYSGRAFFKFPAGTIELSLAAIGGFSKANQNKDSIPAGSIELNDVNLITDDPRYNFAPESWWKVTGTSMDAKMWYDMQTSGNSDKDGDIYMATSDQGRLQSIYELAFLPRLIHENKAMSQDDIGDGNDPWRGAYFPSFDGKVREVNGGTKGKLLNADFMWRTYNPFGRYHSDGFTDFKALGGGRIVNGDSGVKVNPYSDSTKVLAAAFANTPHDWRMATMNNTEVQGYKDKGTEFNTKHAWNGYSTVKGGKLCWEHIENVAAALYDDVRDSSVWDKWEDVSKSNMSKSNNGEVYFNQEFWSYAFENMGWSMDSQYLLTDVKKLEDEDGPLFSVDKKFLYGFWHDSFAARQQLFLIFVRAEPMMMGGGVAGQTPPQLGARAVALVWRDPTKTQNRSGSSGGSTTLANPHRTRILFYHQFD